MNRPVATPENIGALFGRKLKQPADLDPEAKESVEPERRPDIGAAIIAAKAGANAELVERLHRPRQEVRSEESEPEPERANLGEVIALGGLERKRQRSISRIFGDAA